MIIYKFLKRNVNSKDKLLLVFAMFIPCILINRVLDSDIWFLLNSGRYVINYGIPYFEPFTIHKGMFFVMQQWLTDVIFWFIYDRFGENGLFFIVMLCYAAIIFILYKLLMKISENNFFISFLLNILGTIFVYPFMVTRPIIFTLILVLSELYLLELFINSNKKYYLIPLPFISLFLINMQAAMWPLLFVFLIPYLIDSFKFRIVFIDGEGYQKKYLFYITLLMILFGLFNPYGFEAMTYLFRSYGYKEINYIVNEMFPPDINNGWGKFVYFYYFLILFLYLIYRNGKTKLRYLLLTIGTAYMTLSYLRNFVFFVISSIFPLAYYYKNLSIESIENMKIKTNMPLRRFLIVLIFIVMIVIFANKETISDKEIELSDLENSVEFLLNNEVPSRIVLYTGYNDGGYVQYKGIRTYIDPRAEVFVKNNNKKDDIMKEYYDMQYGNLYYKSVLNKYNFTHLLISKFDILNVYLPHDNDYILVYYNNSYKVYKRKNINE